MAEHSRYNISGGEAEPLKNKLGITDQKALEDVETILLQDTYLHFFALLKARRLQFNVKLIFAIHTYFLSTLYTWAGKTRTVEISKDGILFCASSHIKKALQNFAQILREKLPSQKNSKSEVSKKLATIHCEFNAIHPFREGNGRTIRLFLDLLGANYGYGLIDYSKIKKTAYIKASVAGMQKNYSKMQKIISAGLSSGTNP